MYGVTPCQLMPNVPEALSVTAPEPPPADTSPAAAPAVSRTADRQIVDGLFWPARRAWCAPRPRRSPPTLRMLSQKVVRAKGWSSARVRRTRAGRHRLGAGHRHVPRRSSSGWSRRCGQTTRRGRRRRSRSCRSGVGAARRLARVGSGRELVSLVRRKRGRDSYCTGRRAVWLDPTLPRSIIGGGGDDRPRPRC